MPTANVQASGSSDRGSMFVVVVVSGLQLAPSSEEEEEEISLCRRFFVSRPISTA
jgi:hypothetical protein